MTDRFITIRMTLEEVAQLNGVPIPAFLYGKVQHALTAEAREHEQRLRAIADMERQAVNFKLTERQAQMLCALKHGKLWSACPVRWRDSRKEPWNYQWSYGQSMGGAIRRMNDLLITYGLIEQNGRTLTPAGRTKIDEYEAKHGALWQ